jgi:hypothetical protein
MSIPGEGYHRNETCVLNYGSSGIFQSDTYYIAYGHFVYWSLLYSQC